MTGSLVWLCFGFVCLDREELVGRVDQPLDREELVGRVDQKLDSEELVGRVDQPANLFQPRYSKYNERAISTPYRNATPDMTT